MLAGCGTSMGAPKGASMLDLWGETVAGEEALVDVLKTVHHDEASKDIEELLSRCDAFLQLQDDSTIKAFREATLRKLLLRCRRVGTDRNGRSAHQTLLRRLARRRARDSRFKLFTTNYDMCFERAASDLGLIPIDGFSFAAPRHFDPRFFEYDIVKRGDGSDSAAYVPGVFLYYKLHGSVDWGTENGQTVAGGEPADARIIYPARTKFQRSYDQPHLELMARFLAALRDPNSCLVVAGFGFNDDHLTGPILSAVETNPSFRLLVVDPQAETNITDRKTHWQKLDDLSRTADVTFVSATFADFVSQIPDLRALSPAEQLERQVQSIAGRR